MGVTAYSVIVSVLFYNFSLVIVYLLSRSGVIRAKYISTLLLFLTFLGAIRLLLPIDLDQAYVIRSYKVLPAIEDVLSKPLIGPISLGWILLLIWIAGTVAFILRDCIRLWRDHLAAEQLELIDNERISHIAEEFGKGFELKISPDVDLPYVAGFFRPVIYLPNAELSDEQWRDILRHETQHIQACDEGRKLFFRAIHAIFWWNPLVHMSEKDISLLIELQCDERVAGRGNREERESYLRTMMALMKRYAYGDVPVGVSRMIGREEEMKIRFKVLLAPRTKRSGWIRIALSVIMVAMFLASYMVIVQPAGYPDEEDILTIQGSYETYDFSQKIKAGESKVIILENGVYKLYIDGQYVFALDKTQLTNPAFKEIPIIMGGQ